ncbi:phosphoglycerate kinase [Candidatus Woesearchaeota archaeon]|nr:phosphoglycerate kinase [Candidatus Woesearchaeota archaeon]
MKILMRVDLNCSLVNGKVMKSERILAVRKILNNYKNDIVVLLAHQGRKGSKDFISLKQHAELLKVKFVDDLFGVKAVNVIKKLKKGDILLLENVRFYDEEFDLSKNRFVSNLVPLFDCYINNAFSVSHREQTSLTFQKYLKGYKGELVINEIKNLSKLKTKKAVYVLGGVKLEDLYPLMNYVLKNKKGKILCTGILGPVIQEIMKHGLKPKLDELYRKFSKEIILPVDYALEINGKRKNVKLETKGRVLDIGKETIINFKKIIESSNCVFFKGAPGMYEKKGFENGTKELLISLSKAKFSVLGGGDNLSAIKRFKLTKNKFSYVSLSGGAMLAYLIGKELPGLRGLK